jgi:pimeloyl-ACP methyl ester carboxylesterase
MSSVFRSAAGRQLLEQRYRQYLQHWPVPAEHLTIATGHGDTFVIACGPVAAPPLVLLHGAGTNSTIWFSDAALWAQERRTYLVDVIGEPGLSAPARPPLTSEAHAEWFDDVLDGIGVTRAALVGASLGGWLALDYTIRRPARVERLALRAPGGVGRQRFGVILAALALAPFGDRGRRQVLRLALGASADLGEFVDYLALIQKHYRPRRDSLPTFSDQQLRGITAPMFVTVGARDRMLDSIRTARRLRRLVPHAIVTLLPDTGHAVTSDADAIHRFLTEGQSS